jgi:hypothetical protein
MNDELGKTWKEEIVSNLRLSSSICLEGLKKTTENLIQDCHSLGQDLNSGPPKYEAGVLITRQRN